MRTKKIVAALAALTAAAVLTACSSSESEDFNAADVTFAQDMIPHHRQATEMAALAEGRTSNPEVLDLAAKIEAAQEPEIETMTGWLESWGEDVPDDMSGMSQDMAGMDHSGGSMSGMMSAEEMNALEAAEGAAFDEMFLTMMIEHHKGAIEMAKAQQEDGKFPAAVELATKIESDQAAEIETMESLLGS